MPVRPEQLENVPLLYKMVPDEKVRLAGYLKVCEYADGTTLFEDGDKGEGLYIIGKGTVVISRLYDRRRGVRRVMASMSEGASFCEMTLLDNEIRTVTARAQGDVEVWIITREAFDAMRTEAPDLRSSIILSILWAMRERLRRTSSELIALYETAPRVEKLKSIPLFSKLDEEELARVATTIEWRDIPDQEVVFKEGDVGDSLYIVEAGQFSVSKIIDHDTGEEKTLAIVGEGTFFGEMALLDNEPRSATVRAVGAASLLVVDRTVWQDMLRESAKLAAKLLFGILQTTSNRLRHTSRDLVTLYDTGKLAGSITTGTELAEAIMHRLCEALESDVGVVLLKNPYSGQLQIRAMQGTEPDFDLVSVESPLIQEAAMLEDTADFSERLREEGHAIQGLTVRSLLAAPLLIPGGMIGLILIGRKDHRGYVSDHRNLLAGVATQVATAVENARLREEEQARMDHGRTYVQF